MVIFRVVTLLGIITNMKPEQISVKYARLYLRLTVINGGGEPFAGAKKKTKKQNKLVACESEQHGHCFRSLPNLLVDSRDRNTKAGGRGICLGD